ncbi:MAG TPA: CdaR family protein, partial [Thermodesulfobacteriota bacterium]|nr:CdaR family protein [Thermodesulfobacteriota bacterium]
MSDWSKGILGSKGNRGRDQEPLIRDAGKKILAILIAITLWFVANLQHDVERNIMIDVNYTNLPKGLIIVNNPPEKLNIRVRGPRSQLSSLSSKDMVFTIDLSNLSTGTSMFEIRTDQLIPPRDVQVTGISPSEINLDVDKVAQKRVSVEPVLEPPDNGYEIAAKPQVTPETVVIRGPEKLLRTIKSVGTDPVSLKGEKSRFSIEVPIRPPYSLVEIEGGNTVKVTIDIKEKIMEKEFNNLDINFINFDGMKFETDGSISAEIAFEGPFSILNNLNSKDIEL